MNASVDSLGVLVDVEGSLRLGVSLRCNIQESLCRVRHAVGMAEDVDELSIAYVGALQRLGGSGTLRRASEVIGSVTDLDPTERALRPLMEHLISERKLDDLGVDKAGLPLRNVHADLATFSEARDWAKGWLEGSIAE